MNDTTHSRWWSFGTLVIALLVTAAACSTQPSEQGTQGTSNSASSGESASPEAATEESPGVVAVHENVDYYGACGNEVLHLDDDRFYPLLEDEEVDVARYGSGMGVHVSTVPMPSPGDDVGTLTVYSDGYARFVSDSEKFDIWLTQEIRTYNWIC